MIYIKLTDKQKQEIKDMHIFYLCKTPNLKFLNIFFNFIITNENFLLKKINFYLNNEPKENSVATKFYEEINEIKSFKTFNEKKINFIKKNKFLFIKTFLVGEKAELDELVQIIGPISEVKKFSYKFFLNYYEKFRSQWINWNGAEYSKKLNLRTCPYCNTSYIYQYKNNKGKLKTIAQLDHYYSKEKYPYLAFSIFNLIPCCSTCNLIKSDQISSIYPFSKKDIEAGEFKVKINKNLIDSLININFDENNLELELINFEKTNKIFQIKERYSNYKYEIKELIIKNKLYPKSKIKELSNFFIDKTHKNVETELIEKKIKNIIFNFKEEEENFKDKILSKFISDILKDLELKD